MQAKYPGETAMTDIDHLLTQIGELPLDPRLAAIDGAVFAGLAQAARPVLPQAALGAIAGVALIAGVLSSAFPEAPRRHADPAPLGMPVALAPSTLLGDGQ
jgi:hypothetical protein